MGFLRILSSLPSEQEQERMVLGMLLSLVGSVAGVLCGSFAYHLVYGEWYDPKFVLGWISGVVFFCVSLRISKLIDRMTLAQMQDR